MSEQSKLLTDEIAFITAEQVGSDNNSDKESKEFSKFNNYLKTTKKSLRNNRYNLNTKLRVVMAIWSAIFVSCWVWKVGEIVINNNDRYCLSDNVLIALLTTTTIQVIGIVAITMHDLFNGRSEEKIK